MEEDRPLRIRRGTRFTVATKLLLRNPKAEAGYLQLQYLTDKRALREPFAVKSNDARGVPEAVKSQDHCL